MIFVDTGGWFAAFVSTDPNHRSALGWLSSNQEPLLTTDYVVDETLTLLRARGSRQAAIQASRDFVSGALATLYLVTEEDLHAALEVFRRFDDKGWSFTDCTSKVVIERLGIATAFALDHHFRQFGTVAVVP